MISPSCYSEVNLPFDAELARHARSTGASFLVHQDSAATPHLAGYARIGYVQALDFGQGTDFSRAAALFPGATANCILFPGWVRSTPREGIAEELERLMRIGRGFADFTFSLFEVDPGLAEGKVFELSETFRRCAEKVGGGRVYMSFISMETLLVKALRGGYAVPAFCAWNAEVMDVALRTAERLAAPVILMQGPGEFPLMPPAVMGVVAHAVKGRHPVPAALHLDHGDSLRMVDDCLEAGYTSVMLDFSARPFHENAAALKDVASRAHPRGVPVEGEIGKVGFADETASEGSRASALTDPREAAEYARRTGVDFLAVSIGNKHGFYRRDPHLEFGLLSELHAAVNLPLVLHGGTGIPEKDIQRSITMGIAKVNVASELIHGVRTSLTSQWAQGRNQWTPVAMGEAVNGLEKIMEKWIRVTGAAGKA